MSIMCVMELRLRGGTPRDSAWIAVKRDPESPSSVTLSFVHWYRGTFMVQACDIQIHVILGIHMTSRHAGSTAHWKTPKAPFTGNGRILRTSSNTHDTALG